MDVHSIVKAEIGFDEGTESSASSCKPVPSNENTHKGICTDFLATIGSKIVNHLASDFFFQAYKPFSLSAMCP